MSVPLPPGFVLDEDQNNGLPPGFVMDVVDEGGPRSYMSATLDRINPDGMGRRADQRIATAEEIARQRAAAAGTLDARGGSLVASATSTIPFYDEYTGVVNALASAAYNTPGAISDLAAGKGLDRFKAVPEAYRSQVDAQRDAVKFGDEFYPNQSAVTKGTGYALQGVGMVKALPGLAPQYVAGQPVTNVVRTAAAGGASGGVSGGIEGFASEGNLSERLDAAKESAGWGILFGGLLGGGLHLAGNKLSTGQFLPGKGGSGAVLDMAPDQFTKTKAGRLIQTALERSDVPRKDVAGTVGDAVRIFQMSGNSGNRPLTFAQAMEQSLEQRGYAQAAGNVKSIFQQLQTSRFGQGMSQSLDDMANSQQPYVLSTLDDVLGPETLVKEKARIRGDQRAIGRAQDDAIDQARSMGGNEAGTPAIRQLVERAEMDPNSTVTSWLNRAARDAGFAQTGAAQGQKAVPAFRNAAAGDPLGFAKQIVRTINQARTGGAQLDAVTMNLLDEAQTALNAATKSTRGPGGRFGYNKMGSFDEGQQKFRLTYEELGAQTNKLLSIAKDPRKLAELEDGLANAAPEVQRAVRVALKEDIATALNGGKINDVMPSLSGLDTKAQAIALERIFGDDGARIAKVIREVSDEQGWLKSTDARRLSPADRTSTGRNPDIKNIYTANPLTRLANETSLTKTLLGDVVLGMGTGMPAVTAAKVIGHITGPKGASVRQLAQTLAMRARQGGTAPPNAGTLSRMTPANALSSAAATASQGAAPQTGVNALAGPAPVRTSQRAPWQPAALNQETPQIVPRVQTGAQQKADRLAQRAVDLKQREADLMARKADAETLRKAQIETAQAEADAKIAAIQLANTQKVTEAALREVTKAAKARVKAAKSAGVTDKKLTAREAAAKAARKDAEEGLDATLDRERRMKAAAKDEAAAMKDRSMSDRVAQGTDNRVDSYTNAQRIEVAKANAAADVDPVRTFEETGHLAITLGKEPIVIPNIGARDSDDFVRMLSRVEDDLIGPNQGKPEKWSPLTNTLLEQQGNSQYAARKANIPFYKGKDGKWFANVDGQRIRLPANIDDKAAVRRTLVYALGRRALETEIRKGLVPGWRTPAERQTLETGKKMAKTAGGALALTVGAAGVATGAREVDKRQQSARAKRIMESPELTKIVQRSLKAVRQYDGRADGKFDGDVQIGVSQFQGTYGLGKSSDPATLDTATLKKLEEMLVFEGKTKLADEIRDIRRGKLKPKEK